jgi:hypothetical protein
MEEWRNPIRSAERVFPCDGSKAMRYRHSNKATGVNLRVELDLAPHQIRLEFELEELEDHAMWAGVVPVEQDGMVRYRMQQDGDGLMFLRAQFHALKDRIMVINEELPLEDGGASRRRNTARARGLYLTGHLRCPLRLRLSGPAA